MTKQAGYGILTEAEAKIEIGEKECDCMTDHELLLAISGIMDKKLIPIENRLDAMQDEIHTTKDEIHSMQGEIHSMQDEIHSMQGDIHDIKLFQENVILPRLNTIESCYTDTYERYKSYADKMESVFSDTELLKRVVSEHSEKLQKIS